MSLEIREVAIKEGSKPFSFKLNKGEALSFYFRNKGEKESFLNLFKGEEKPFSGKIYLSGKEIDEDSPISYINEKSLLFSHLNIKNNYLSYLRNKEVEGKEEIADRSLTLLNLGSVKDKKPEEISSKQYIRGLIGKAMLTNPSLLILDDFLSKSDGFLRTDIWKEIRKYARLFSIPILFLTLNPSEALLSGDYLGYIKEDGSLLIDTPINIYQNPINVDMALVFSNPKAFVHNVSYSDNHLTLSNVKIYVPSLKAKLDECYKEEIGNKIDLLAIVRSEEIKIDEFGQFKGVITSIESLSSKFILRVKVDEDEYSLISQDNYKIGDQIAFSLKTEPYLFFDKNSLKAL